MHWYRHRQIIIGSGERSKNRTFDCFELEDISHFNKGTRAFRKRTFIVGLKCITKSAMVASRYLNERRVAALKLTGSTAALNTYIVICFYCSHILGSLPYFAKDLSFSLHRHTF